MGKKAAKLQIGLPGRSPSFRGRPLDPPSTQLLCPDLPPLSQMSCCGGEPDPALAELIML